MGYKYLKTRKNGPMRDSGDEQVRGNSLPQPRSTAIPCRTALY
jgi:hypothetical protein